MTAQKTNKGVIFTKRICFITPCSLPIPTTKGGAIETLVEYIINENEKLRNYHITVISVYDEKAKALSKSYKNVDFIYVRQRPKYIKKVTYQIYRCLKHINIYIPFSWEMLDVLGILKKLDMQDAYVYEGGPTTMLPLLSKVIQKNKLYVHLHWDGLANKKKDKCFQYLLPVSNYIGNQWKKGAGCSSEKIIPLFNCAKIDRFIKKMTDNEKQQLKKKLNIPQNSKVLIFTGRIVQEKGIKELVEAFEVASTSDLTLLIIGSANFGASTNTPYEKEVQLLIKNCKKRIVFTGFVHQSELYKFYNIADLAVMPSLFNDPAPLVCIEAQAAGVPLIATRVGGLPEYVCEGSAELIDVDDNLVSNLATAIDDLLSDENKRKEMGVRAFKHASQFSTENYYKHFCEIIENTL